MPLPRLREELDLLPGPMLADGQPSHTLHDPSRNLFFQLDWPAVEILRRWPLDDPEAIVADIAQNTSLRLAPEEVLAVARFLEQNQLLQPAPGQAAELTRRAATLRGSFWTWLLHNYLFFRIPLIKPDRWLSRLVGPLEWLYQAPFWFLTAVVLVFGLVEVLRDWAHFSATFVDHFTFAGMVSYGVALTGVKVLHELGHALTAKRFGCRVPTMGVAFLVLWPVAYTDTNEVWRLTSRRQRLQAAAAGILTEITLAVWATLAWVMLADGVLRNMAFMLATITWISSLAINASPFMRFDGYFLLSDFLGMPNLHARASALARWALREWLFALGEPRPEALPRARHVGIIVFAYVTWVYRLTVFLGIAVLVYTFFIKAVGIFLFMVEIVWFVLLPPFREIQAWQTRWPAIRQSPRARRTAFIAMFLVVPLGAPWPGRISATALLRPERQLVLYAPLHAQVASLPVAEGLPVKAGTLLMQLSSSELENRRNAALARRNQLRWQASAGAFDKDQLAQWQVIQQQLESAEAELVSIGADATRYAPRAPFDGVLRDIEPELQSGVPLRQNEVLARLVSEEGEQVVAFLDEESVARIAVGDSARFYADGLEGPFLPLNVIRIDSDASRTLAEAELSNLYGGALAVRERNGQLYPEQAIYRVTLKTLAPAGSLAGHSWRGQVVIHGRSSMPVWHFLRTAVSVFWREAGF